MAMEDEGSADPREVERQGAGLDAQSQSGGQLEPNVQCEGETPGGDRRERTSRAGVRAIRIFVPLLLAGLLALGPTYAGLSYGGRAALFILVLASGLWITEAIPAFAVSLLVIGYAISVLGRPDGVMNAKPGDWERYIATWGSPLIWLFFGGFALARAAERTGLTEWISLHLLSRVGERPRWLLAASMLVTFTFSMFISNTAAATMMVAIVMPVVHALESGDRLRRSLLLGIACAANLGGMGTIIGSPPNAIAAGALADVMKIDFAKWMLLGLPPSLGLLCLSWGYLQLRHPALAKRVEFPRTEVSAETSEKPIPFWQRLTVMVTFTVTVGLWMTQALHGVPATVISFLPICVLTATGVLSGGDVCSLRWDVLLLIAGGLSLGLAVTDSGLADYLVANLHLRSLGLLMIAFAMAYVAMLLSNLMSNTAAANVLVPIGLMATVGGVAVAGETASVVIPIALSASSAMALPISTPPNAIVHSSGEIATRDLLEIGLLFGVLAPLLTVMWCRFVLI